MRAFSLSCAIGFGAASLPGERDWTKYTFEQYSKEFGKAYNGLGESESRKAAFLANLVSINRHNADNTKTWFASVNEFTDLTNVEFRAQRAHGTKSKRGSTYKLNAQQFPDLSVTDVPSSLDWRSKSGVVTPVKNQGSCGSCWAFSATETMESALAIATGNAAPVLSPQQIVSCSPNPKHCGGTGGCDGSTQELAFDYTETTGLTLESDYEYTAETGTCETSRIVPVAQNTGFVQLPKNNYTALISAVANVGPIAISVAAGGEGWQIYGGGVLSSGCDWDEDHAVQLVGYGTDSGSDYWLVRNSWGSSWGDGGYIKIKRYGEGKEPCGTDSTPQDGSACEGDTKAETLCGLCGILSDSSYPTGLKNVGPAPGPSPPSPPSPSPGPSPPAPSPTCDSDTDQTSCEADGCKWCVYPFGGFCFASECGQSDLVV